MMRTTGILSTVLVSVLLLTATVCAAAPQFPFNPYGTVHVNAEYAPPETVVGAWCDGVEYASTTVQAWEGQIVYAIDVPGDDPETGEVEGCVAGEVVSFTITVEGDVLQADQSGTWATGQEAEVNLTAFRPLPALDVEKDTNRHDADAQPGPLVQAGEPVTWTYVVTNTGNVELADVVVTDDVEQDLACGRSVLAIGESFSCTLTGVATTGQYTNTATATGVYASKVVSDTDLSHYYNSFFHVYLPVIVREMGSR